MPEQTDANQNGEDAPASYWLNVSNAWEALQELFTAANSDEYFALLDRYPILGLPEMPDAILDFARSEANDYVKTFGTAKALTLKQVQSTIRNEYHAGQAVLLKKCGILLMWEQEGKLRLHAERAIRLFQDARNYCNKTSKDFADCLLNEGSARARLTTLGVDPQFNTDKAIELYQQAREIYARDSSGYAVSLRNEGSARQDLARLHIAAQANLEKAITLNREARTLLAPNDIETARNLLDEGNAHLFLGMQAVDAETNFQTAVSLYQSARTIYQPDDPEGALSFVNEAKARVQLAKELGIDPQNNAEAVMDLCTAAYEVFGGENTVQLSNALTCEADARVVLAAQDVEPKTNLEAAIDRYALASKFIQEEQETALLLCRQADAHSALSKLSHNPEEHLSAATGLYEIAKGMWPPGSEDLFKCLVRYAELCARLAESDEHGVAHDEKALDLYDQALAICEPNNLSYPQTLYNYGTVYRRLAQKGVEATQNLERALEMLEKASEFFEAGSWDLGLCFQQMANTHSDLADLGTSEKSHLETALDFYRKAKECFSPGNRNFAQCLSNEAAMLQELAKFSVYSPSNIEGTMQIYQQAREMFTPGTSDYGLSFFNEANARRRLAQIGIEPEKNRHEAIRLYQLARKHISPEEAAYSKCLMNEGGAHQGLADQGIDPATNLEKNLQLLEEAMKNLSPGTREYADILMNKAVALVRFADLGISVQENLEEAIRLSNQARNCYAPGSVRFAMTLQNETNARKELGGFGVAAQENTEEAIELYRLARKILLPTSAQFAQTLMNEGIARKQLADLSIETTANLKESLALYEQARSIYPPHNISYARCQMNEGNSHLALASLGIDTIWNLEHAVSLYHEARQMFASKSIDAAVTFMYEGNAHNQLASLEIDEETNSRQAIELYQRAREVFQPDSLDFGRCLMLEGNSRQHLATLDIDGQANLEEALRLYVKAHDTFLLHSPEVLLKSPDFASCLINEGGARFNLAELGVDAESNLNRVIELCREGSQYFRLDSASFAQALSNEGAARQRLAERGIDQESNRSRSAEIFRGIGELFMKLSSYLDAVKAYESLAWVERELGHVVETQAAFQKAIEALEKVRTTTLLTQDRRTWMERYTSLYRGMVKTSLQLKQYETALDYVERARSRALLDMLYVRDFEPRHYPKEKFDIYREKRERAELLQTTTIETIDPQLARNDQSGELRREKAALLNDLRRMEEEMRQLDPDYFALAKPASVAEMKEVAAAMQRTLVIIWMESARTAVFFVRPDGELSCLELPELGINRVVEWLVGPPENVGSTGWVVRYLQHLKDNQTPNERVASREAWINQIDETTTVLHNELLGKIHTSLKEWNETRVTFVVGGLLGMLPLHAASWRDQGTTHYLLETVDVVYAPSVWVLQRCLSRKRTMEVPVLAAGTSGKGAALVFSKWEIKRIKELLESSKGPNSCASVLDSDATVEFVLKNMPKHAINHLSCHGKWNADDPLSSSLSFYDEDLPLSRLLQKVRLESCSLVVLSACESGTGYSPTQESEEYLGLPAGFIFAGARAVVGSLWSVLDPPTALLMIKLYQNLLDGAEVSDALRNSQIWLMNLKKEQAIELLREVVEVVGPNQKQPLLSSLDKWSQHFEPRPFARPYYWGAFQALGSPEAVFNGKRN